MASITVRPVTSEKEWEDFLSRRPEANFLQSWHYVSFHEALRKRTFRMGFFQSDRLIGVMGMVVETAKRGTYLSVAGGPIIDWNDADAVGAFKDASKRLASESGCAFIRMRPQLPDTETSRKTVREIGFRDAPMHLEAELTSQLDLTPSEAMLLSNMRKTTRYEIRRAEKLGISVTKTTDTAAIGGFHALQLETARRQNFTPFSYPYLSEQFRSFADHGMAMLYSATYQGNLLAQAFMIFYGSEAVYHYGASTDAGRTYPGAYIIQWAAIRDAKHRGMKRYNFWGVTSPADINHRFYGVSVFKRGFGGEDVSYLHAQDLVMHPGRYTVNLAVETVRRKIRRL